MRIAIRRRTPAELLLVAAICVSATACTEDKTPSSASGTGAQDNAPATGAASAAAVDPANPATWKLPLEAYLPSKTEDDQLRRATNSLNQSCMAKAGFADWKPAPELPKLGPKTLTDWRYGIHDQELSSKRGYHPDAAEQSAYDEAMQKGAVSGLSGKAAETLDSCGSQSKQRIGGGDKTYGELAQRLSSDAGLRAKQQPEVTAAFKAWSGCMKQSGYSYKEPLDASDDPKFNSKDVTRLEVDTALADLKCRTSTNVAKIWYDAEVKLQKEAEEKNAPALRAERKELDSYIKNAATALSGAQ
ncbi:hypothetical protein [Kitasatospora herbaricolor]|uniref:Lipoprotein n=1 Tax=Kitasatospora herbaricolor TaxID=68217 RepID=A0ABZ1WKV8_9ACTN|nr:hypothetical protein [Kitasatospora herbaricolor]